MKMLFLLLILTTGTNPMSSRQNNDQIVKQDVRIQMPEPTEQEATTVAESMSKKKIAALVAATAITTAALTAVVTLTIHFTDCKK